MLKSLLLFLPVICFASQEGNLSVPGATQPTPLVSFGQLIYEKGMVFGNLSVTYKALPNGYTSSISPLITYGVLDNFSVSLFTPVSPQAKSLSHHSSGIQDLIFQLEYAYYQPSFTDANLQGTIVVNTTFPTGSSSKNPPTGTGCFTYFLGTTFSYMSANWYAFVSPGAQLRKQSSLNSYLYQWGFSRYIGFLSPKNWIFDLMLEFDGTYTPSLGNLLTATPSIWLSSDRITLQLGSGLPLIRQKGMMNYALYFSIGGVIKF